MTESKIITDADLFEIFCQYTNYNDSKVEAEKLIKQFNSVVPDDFQDFFLNSYKRFKRLKTKHCKKGNDFIKSLASRENSFVVNDVEVAPSKSKQRRKEFTALGDRMKKERTDGLVNYLNNYIKEECPELSLNQLLGYLLHRVNIQSDKDIANIGHSLFEESLHEPAIFTNLEAISLMHSLTLSREQIRKLRYMLTSKGIYFPTTNELLESRKALRPVVDVCLDGKGVCVQYNKLVKMTIESVLKVVSEGNEFVPKDGDSYLMCFKDGGDGAGQQTTMKSKSMIDSKENIFQYSITPLSLTCTRQSGLQVVMWKNHAPNSARTLRPIFLIREAESNEELLQLVIKSTDSARNKLNEEGLCSSFENKKLDINIFIQDTMKDLKFKRKISGLGGADCILCESKTVDWTTLERVEEGFKIEQESDETWLLYEQLVDNDGNVPVKPGDFDTRKGLTKKPITNSSQKSITITHSYINGTTWFLKLLYRCHIDFRHWIEKSGPLGEPLRHSKERVLGVILERTGLYLDVCNKAGGKGGTSTDGPQGRRFYSEELVPVLKELCHQRYVDHLLLLHKQLSIILRIVSCTRKINIELFKILCYEMNLNLINNFPWARLNHTLHGTIHHSAELIVLNDGYGLGMLSEEGLEANNKDIRNYLQFLCRKCSPQEQLTDVMNRLLERSDPVIHNNIIQAHIPKHCKECGSTEHTIRSHARLISKPSKEFDNYVEEILLD